MLVTIEHLGRKYRTNLAKGIDLSSTYGLNEKEPKAWGVPNVAKEPVKAGDWVGTVKDGASVNFYNIHFNPHGNGTHTEGYGHISEAWPSVNDQIQNYHFIAYYIKLEPEEIDGDQIVTLSRLKEKVKKWNIEALLVHTGNYPTDKDFSNDNPPYFEPELITFIKEMGVQHFLTDLPSVDKEDDGGALASHKAFWSFPDNPRKDATISEMLQFPEELPEGLYLLNLQVAPFHNDASPSRPVIYPLEEL